MQKILMVGGMFLVVTWTGLQLWSTRTLSAVEVAKAESEQSSLASFKEAFAKMPAYKLTFLGTKFLEAGDYEFAKTALEEATKKDRFYRDAFRYYAYVLQAMGENDRAELAMRRAKTLDPRDPQ